MTTSELPPGTEPGERAAVPAGQQGDRGRGPDALSSLFDESTFRHLGDIEIGPGWRCWEVGAGGPSVLHWMAEQVGPAGTVLATDIDVSWAEAAASTTIETRLHDVGRDPPPRGPFDLVHARLVLVHVPERDAALHAMVRALRPGGWLVVEDADPALQPLSCLDPDGPEDELANRIRSGLRALMAARRVDLAYGRTLPKRLRTAGLVDVVADAYFPVAMPACARLEIATINLIRGQLVEHGIATDEEVDRHLENVAAGKLDLAQPPMITAWGRVPAL